MNAVHISVENVNYSYEKTHPILKNITFTAKEHDCIGLIGANGVGKSTLLRLMVGLNLGYEGNICVGGIPVVKKNLSAIRKNIGYVFQDADSQIIASSVQAEVAFGPMNLKLSKEEVRERVDQALEYMDLQDYRSRPPHYLSGGEKKRVSIADIIAMHSEVILFDEPTAALDPLSADMLEEVLEKLSGEGKALLVSTHDVDFAYRWAERVLVFDQGQVIADGEVLSVFQEEAVLERAHLKKPELLTVYEVLLEKGLIRENSFPRQAEELAEAMDL